MRPKIVAIHQPNLFPWLGYFDKIARCDIFVFLDNVQFPKTGGVWTNRVKLLVSGEDRWITVPVVRSYHGVKPIKSIEIDDRQQWRKKFLKTLELNYAKTPYYRECIDFIARLVYFETACLADFNINAIQKIAGCFGIESQVFVRSSELPVDGSSTDLLIAITKVLGGGVYLCGGGSSGYQEDDKFEGAGIILQQQGFNHPIYKQRKSSFTPGLSILDALFFCGFSAVKELLQIG